MPQTERERAWWRTDRHELEFQTMLDECSRWYDSLSLMEQAAIDFERRIRMKEHWQNAPQWARDAVTKMMQ